MADRVIKIENTINSLLEGKKYSSLKDILSTLEPWDIAAVFNNIDSDVLPLLFRLLPKDLAADTFVEMDSDSQQLLIQGFSDSELKAVVDELFVDDAADIIEEMPANVVSRILKQADPEKRKYINEILNYPEDSAGSIMTTEYVRLLPFMTAYESIKQIRRTGIDKETVSMCYVTDSKKTLLGVVSLRMLILADEDSPVESLMETSVVSVTTWEDQETVASMFYRYGYNALPVVDKENRLVGIVTSDDAIDVIVEEATEDIEKMAAVTPSDKPYLKTGVFQLWKSRMPWLLLLMISATFTGLIISSFEDALSKCAVLIAYIPMIMGTGGNSGSQAAVTVIRGLSLGEIAFRDTLRVIWKETRVSLLCGLTLAIVGFGKFLFIDRTGFDAALAISITLLATVFVAKFIGCTLPIVAKKLKLDPAVCANPFISTIVDTLSLLIYFVFAKYFLKL